MPGGGPNTPPDGPNPHSAPVDPVEVENTTPKPDVEKPVDGDEGGEA